jgi:hypothetical protein
MAVGLQDQLAAVLVSLPFGDHLHVDALFDCASDKHSAQTAVRVGREFQSLASVGESLSRLVNRKKPFVRLPILTELLDQRSHLRINRDDKTNIGLVTVNNHATGFQIGMGASNCCGLRLSKTCQAQKFDKVARLFGIMSVKLL